MTLAEITYDVYNEQDRREERVYLKMLDKYAEDAKDGCYDVALISALEMIAELQGYELAQIKHVTF